MPFCTFSVEPLKNQESAVMISDRFDLKPEEASYIIDAIAEDGDVGYFEVIGGGEVALGYIIVVVDSRGLVKRCYY